jgi:hypothetical protein
MTEPTKPGEGLGAQLLDTKRTTLIRRQAAWTS